MEMSEQQRKHEQALRDLEDELVHLRQQIVSFETSETKCVCGVCVCVCVCV